MVPEGIKEILAGIKGPCTETLHINENPRTQPVSESEMNRQLITSQGSLGKSITSSVGLSNSIPKGTVLVGLQGSCILFCILTPNYDRLAHRRLFSLTRLLFSYLSLMRALFSLLRIHLHILGSLSLGNYRSRAS
jgi:hypothetical protein